MHIQPSVSDFNNDYTDGEKTLTTNGAAINIKRVQQLQDVVAILNTAGSSRSLLSSARIQAALRQAQLSRERFSVDGEEDNSTIPLWAEELEWAFISKAAIQIYGLLLNVLVEQTLPLNDDISYWDEVLSSYFNMAVYYVQTSPLRLWKQGNIIYQDVRGKAESTPSTGADHLNMAERISMQWLRFYGLVKQSLRDRSMAGLKSRAMSPLTFQRAIARRKRSEIKNFRELSASGLGVLMDEGLNFDIADEGSINPRNHTEDIDKDEWKSVVVKSVALIETVLRHTTSIELGTSDFEETVFKSVEDEPGLTRQCSSEQTVSPTPAMLRDRLQHILQEHMPNHILRSNQITLKYGKPSRIIRYWLPTSVLLLSCSTLLRILFNRQAQIITLVRDLGTTVVDFWYNWVVEPVKNIIGTIRHDGDSGITIMSKRSLEGDRASLERMVVDFAIDNPNTSNSSGPLTEVQISDIRTKVREGDLTPVLKAYEQDLHRPFMGTVRGDLIRALLIQVQKTKVDVEVAVAGIDNLIKSQELVFGYILKFCPQVCLRILM